MGNPTFENFFEENVWNYFYQVKSGDNILEEKRIKVFFDTNGFLNDIEIIKLD
jgi:outer membrane protein assembly factor BamE (lipoprotein component of BamABCDE complex)